MHCENGLLSTYSALTNVPTFISHPTSCICLQYIIILRCNLVTVTLPVCQYTSCISLPSSFLSLTH
ncbi:hypothetical protein VPHF99_0152 [Vibrio phage F99]